MDPALSDLIRAAHGAVTIGLGGWMAWAHLQKKSYDNAIEKQEKSNDAFHIRIATIERDYWSRREHEDFRKELNATMEKMFDGLRQEFHSLIQAIKEKK